MRLTRFRLISLAIIGIVLWTVFGYALGHHGPSSLPSNLVLLLGEVHTIAVYARVSTHDKGQNVEVQLAEIRNYLSQRGWGPAKEYIDVTSGAKERRPLLDKLLSDVRRGWVTVIVIVRLDRLSRSLKHLVNLLAELGERKVALISIKEGLDFSTSTGRLLFHVIGALAEFERDLIRERVKSGLAFAKSRGVRIGRPTIIDQKAIAQIHEMKAKGASLRMIAQSLHISRSAAHKVIASGTVKDYSNL